MPEQDLDHEHPPLVKRWGPDYTGAMKPAAIADTPPSVREFMIDGYRRMSPAQKLQRVVALTQGVQQMALARIRAQHPHADEHEMKLRLASLWLPAEVMRSAFGWDSSVEGY